MDPFSSVKDSSIWQSSNNFSMSRGKDPYMRMGIVKKVYQDMSTSELRYLVEVRDRSDAIEINCRMLRRFGGVYNYEDVVYQGYTFTDKPDPVQSFDAKAGDVVLVAMLNGEGREAIILGGVMHPARMSTIPITSGPQYMAEFNGMQTVINQNGEYILTFRGIPTNISALNNIPSIKLPPPTYNTSVGTSFIKMDQTGSLEFNDNSTSGIQNVRIDKANGFLILNSGKISLKMTKSSQQVDLTCKIFNTMATTSITENTTVLTMNASDHAILKSPKVAIGKDGIELLNEISQLIDAIGMIIPISPVGPCDALNTTGQWSQVMQVQSKIKEITGSL